MKRHGWPLYEDADQRAASNNDRSFPGSIARFSNARGLQRWLIKSWIGASAGAGLLFSAILFFSCLLFFRRPSVLLLLFGFFIALVFYQKHARNYMRPTPHRAHLSRLSGRHD